MWLLGNLYTCELVNLYTKQLVDKFTNQDGEIWQSVAELMQWNAAKRLDTLEA